MLPRRASDFFGLKKILTLRITVSVSTVLWVSTLIFVSVLVIPDLVGAVLAWIKTTNIKGSTGG